jgi:hypothetical protein
MEDGSTSCQHLFTLEMRRNLSLAIYDNLDATFRELTRAEPVQSGKHSLASAG